MLMGAARCQTYVAVVNPIGATERSALAVECPAVAVDRTAVAPVDEQKAVAKLAMADCFRRSSKSFHQR